MKLSEAMLHGVTAETFSEAIKQTEGSEYQMAVLMTAREIVSLFDFEHLSGIQSLELALIEARKKINYLRVTNCIQDPEIK